jgi:hypothetical protein
MSANWKPQGYSTVSVYMVVDDAQRVIDFLKKTFDATELRRFEAPDGKIMHAEVRIDDTVVMLASAAGPYPLFLCGSMSMFQTWMPPTRKRCNPGASPFKNPFAKRATRTNEAASKTPPATPGGAPQR